MTTTAALMPTPVGGPFDDLANLAAQVGFVPVALVALADGEQLQVEGQFGLVSEELSPALELCQRALAQRDWLELREPPEGKPAGLRWFTGIPLRNSAGEVVGALAVLDRAPRRLTTRQRAGLQTVAHEVEAELKTDARLEIGRAEGRDGAELLAEGFRAGEFAELRGRRLLEQKRHVRHAFRPADNEHRAAPRRHALVGGGERLEAGGAVAMHGHGGDVLGNAGAQRDDAGDVGGIGGLADAAEDHFVDDRGIEGRAGEQGVDGDASEFLREIGRAHV